MTRRKGTRPEQFAGPFQDYEEIPQRYRLETYAGQYQDRKTWQRYCETTLFEGHDTKYMRQRAQRAGNSWLSHMQQEGRHHALATPRQANRWCHALLESDRTRRTCYEVYYIRIYQFYDHLKASCHHPHLYNPLLVAAIQYPPSRHLWEYRIDTRPEVVSRE